MYNENSFAAIFPLNGNQRYSILQGKYPRKQGLLHDNCPVSLHHVT